MVSLPIAQPLQTLMDAGSHHFAALWKITRKDATVLRFTDHDSPLVYQGDTYSPAGSFSPTARQQTTGLNPHNLEITGILDSDLITHDDLRAGKYRDAKVEESIVDWRVPWAGAIFGAVYWLDNVTLLNGQWQAQVMGLTRYLQPYVGGNYTRTCRRVLGDAGCAVVLGPFTVSGVITAVDATYPKKVITCSTLIGSGADYFTFGDLIITSGANAGLKGEVKTYDDTTGVVTLQLSQPYSFVIGDTFDIVAGCAHTFPVCGSKFDNVINFGGFPNVPGQDRALATPNTM